MSDLNQTEIPQSFMSLFVKPGHSKPSASLETVVSRYEVCEDMACILTEQAETIKFNLNLSENQVLTECYRGLRVESVFSEREADWVVHRLAELLSWPPPLPIEANTSKENETTEETIERRSRLNDK